MNAFVSTLRSKKTQPGSSLHAQSEAKKIQSEELESTSSKQMNMSMSISTSSNGSCHSSTHPIVTTSIQSPSRIRGKSFTIQKEIPLIYSPLVEGYKGNQSHLSNKYATFAETIPNPTDFNSRWEYMSTLAGDHRQSPHILNVSRRRIDPSLLKFGITPLLAQNIFDFTFNRDFFGKHELPSFLDLVEELFPNLKRLSLQSEHTIQAQFIKKPLKEQSDEGIGFSADGDDEIPTNENNSELFAKFDSSIAMAERESERMERLYILYRLPSLTHINQVQVTEQERKLSRPDQLSGYKMENYEWVTAAMISSSPSASSPSDKNNESPLRYYCTEEDVESYGSKDNTNNDGLEIELNSMIDLARDGDRSNEVIDSIRNERKRLSSKSLPTRIHNLEQLQGQSHSIYEEKANSARSLLRMFPRTGRAIAVKSTDSTPSTPERLNIPKNNSAWRNNNELIKNKGSDSKVNQSNRTTEDSLHIPSKNNLDSFLQKGNAKNVVDRKSPHKAASEATDIAIAGTGQLISKLSLKNNSHDANKENVSKERREGKVENNQQPLVGSMVKVKIKKRKGIASASRPPPSPSPSAAAALRRPSFRARLKKNQRGKLKSMLSCGSLMDDEDHESEDSTSNCGDESFTHNSLTGNEVAQH